MRRFLPLSLGGAIIITIPLIAYTLVRASPEPGAPAHWSTARDISESPDGIAGARIEMDNNGYLHLTWIDDKTGSGDPYYAKSTDAGTSWSAFESITTTTFESWPGDIAIGPDGTVHVVWIEVEGTKNHRIKYARREGDGSWSVSDVEAALALPPDPAITVDANYIYIVWQKRVDPGNANIWYSYKSITDGTWVEAQSITDTVTSSFAPDLAVDSHGNVHTVWQEDVNYGAVWYSKGSGNGSFNWSPVVTVSQSLTGCATPAIAVGSDDYVHVVWAQRISKDEQYVYYANFPYNDTSSITPVKVFTVAIGVSEIAPTYLYPRVAIRGENEVHVVWHGKRATDITDQIWYAVSEDKGSSWSTPIKIPQEATNQALSPDIALDGKMGHVVWQGKDESGKYQVMYSRGFPYAIYLPIVIKSYSGG